MEAERPSPTGGARRVLVIDDSPTIHKVVANALRPLGVEATFVRDGAAGIAKAKDILPHLILLDFMMPGLNGYQVCKALGQDERLEKIPIVLMSAKGELIGEKLVRTMGIVDYITKPFPPEALLAVTQHALDRAAAPQAEASGEVEPLMKVGERSPEATPTDQDLTDPRGRMALRGDLGMIPASEVFQLLKFQSHTGILHLARGHAHLEVALREGGIVFARARNVEDEFLLGRFLIEIGAIAPRDLEVFLQNRNKDGNRLLGEQLVRLSHITPEQLHLAIEKQTEALIFEALRWGEGEFSFAVTDKLPPEAIEANLQLSIDQILMEGFRRVDEWGMIEKEIRDFHMVLAPSRDSTGVRRYVQLQLEEERILALVDGNRSIQDVIRMSRRSSFEVCGVLYRLLSSRIIRKRSLV